MVNLLGGRRSRTVEEMAARFDVSPRTVYRDLNELSREGIPVARDDFGYRLLDTATLRPLALSAREHAVLKLALRNPTLRSQPALQKVLDGLEAKLDAVSSLREESPTALQLASIDRSGPKAAEALGPLEEAITRRRRADIVYSSLSGGDEKRRVIEPWRVFQRDGAWYCVGRCHLAAAPRIFRLDRIGAVEILGETFAIPAGFDLDDYLRTSWRVFRGDREHRIVLRFEEHLGPLLLNSRHHPDETVARLDDGSIEYRVRLDSLEEIARWILGFGGAARVMAPDELVRKVRRMARAVLAND
jgi:predicted DNA-binding transcriptional regulator YafY